MSDRIIEYWKRAPEDQFDLFFLYAPVLMHALDEDMNIIKVSRFWAAKLGYKPDEMIGRKITDFMQEASAAKLSEGSFVEVASGKSIYNVEFEFQCRDGKVFPVLMSSSGQFDQDGQLMRSLAIILDNTEAAAAKKALEANNAKSRFLAAMSHEIRTPMNAILGFAQLLRRSELDRKQRSQLDAIVTAGNNLMRLLSDLLDLSRMEAGRMTIEHEVFRLTTMIDEVMDLWHSSAHEKGLRLRSTIDRDIPARVSSDSGRIRQILNNFLSNAIKYTEEGNITLSVEQTKREGDVCHLRFEVEDTGGGIAPDQVEKLFVPFVQVDARVAKEHGGWGLGLSICNHLAELLDATIGVESKPGIGSRFYLDIPMQIAAETPVRTRIRDESQITFQAENPLRILAAEDNLMNQELIENMLNEIGHEVVIVRNGFEAVNALQDMPFDLVLMDISMPGLDGVGATEQIRALSGEHRKIPIIAVTGNITTGARELYLSMGMNDYIPKPVSMQDLGAAIERATTSP